MNLVELLLRAQAHQAGQLAAFMLHLISTNYVPMRRRAEWALLSGENLNHVEAHRWPPLSYLTAAAAWEREQQKKSTGWLGCVFAQFAPPPATGDLVNDWGGEPASGAATSNQPTQPGQAGASRVTALLDMSWLQELQTLEAVAAQAVEPRSRCTPDPVAASPCALPNAPPIGEPPPLVATATLLEGSVVPSEDVVIGEAVRQGVTGIKCLKAPKGPQECIAVCIDRSGSMGSPFSTDRSRMEAVKQSAPFAPDRLENHTTVLASTNLLCAVQCSTRSVTASRASAPPAATSWASSSSTRPSIGCSS